MPGCLATTYMGKMSYPGFNKTYSGLTYDECSATCYLNSKCRFIRFHNDGRCDLRGTPNITSGSFPNATVDQLCFPAANCECKRGRVGRPRCSLHASARPSWL